MNPTTDSQALLTKTFLHFIPFFFFFLFSPLSIVFAQQQLHTTFPYSLLLCPTMSNYRSTISTLSIYHSISFIYIMQLCKAARATQSQTHKAKNPKQKKKTQTVQFRLQRFSCTTQAPNQFSNFSSSVKTQTRNTQTPQAQFL